MNDLPKRRRRAPSTTSVAVAVVALARFLAGTNPALAAYLAGTLDSATQAGISPADLQLLKSIVQSLSTTR